MKVEFVGTFAEVNLRSAEWMISHPNVRLIREEGPIRGQSGQSSNDDSSWTVTIEYEERALPRREWRAAETQ